MLLIPRVFHRTKVRGLAGASHGKFVHIGLPKDCHSCLLQIHHGFCRVSRHKMFQHPGGTGGQHPFCTQIVLDCRRHSRQRAGKLSGPDPAVCFLCFPESAFLVHRHITVKCIIQSPDPGERFLRRFHGAGLSGPDLSAQLQGCQTH